MSLFISKSTKRLIQYVRITKEIIASLLKTIYAECANEDGFLYLTYNTQEVYGNYK